MIENLPTIRTALRAHCIVAALCLECEHIRELDLKVLAKRHANMALIHLPLRCRCGARRFRIVVSERPPGGGGAGQPGHS